MGIGTKLNPTPWSFIERQHVFFAATAAPDGRVNVSPKGMRTLRILGEAHIRWLNPSGSGYETAADMRASNRDWMRGVYTEKYRKHEEEDS